MSAGKHTQGPWVLVTQRLPEKYRDVLVKLGDGSRRVARLNRTNHWEAASYGPVKHQYILGVDCWFDDEAPVIAAAPELLEAAQAAWNCIAELSPTQARVEVAQMLQAAIARATGESA